MTSVHVLQYDAFSKYPDKGNPAGVVLEADALSDEKMQAIAREVGFNETVFVIASEKADIRLRYFTPGHEIALCGHATMAALFCLKTRGYLGDANTVQIETNVGILPIAFTIGDPLLIKMKQDSPQFVAFDGDRERLALSLGLSAEDLAEDLPIVYGYTGAWTMLVPIRQLDSFERMKPYNPMFPEILTEMPKASVHPFCLQTLDAKAFMHARHFSSPYSGTVEDPVTGTASGVMGAYYMTYLDASLYSIQFLVEQGQEIGRDGRVNVEVIRQGEGLDVYISGTAVFVKAFTCSLA